LSFIYKKSNKKYRKKLILKPSEILTTKEDTEQMMRKDKDVGAIAHTAHEQATAMLEERTNRRKENEGGIADILNKWGDKS
jgi:hypothetical protein